MGKANRYKKPKRQKEEKRREVEKHNALYIERQSYKEDRIRNHKK